MCRNVFTVGTAVTRNYLALADVHSYVTARRPVGISSYVARCLTGLGPTSTSRNANGDLGGLYFNGVMIPNSDERAPCGSDVIIARPGPVTAGVINFYQCRQFSTVNEGVYTCIMRNSSMMDQTVKFGVYFIGRSESVDLYMYVWYSSCPCKLRKMCLILRALRNFEDNLCVLGLYYTRNALLMNDY